MQWGVENCSKKISPVSSSMHKILIGLVISLLLSPAPAHASTSVPYKNQKAGQFCKVADKNKTVTRPDGSKLICKKDGNRARWKSR
jgi:hypothetical protein